MFIVSAWCCVQVLRSNGDASRAPGSQPSMQRAVHTGTQQTLPQGVQATYLAGPCALKRYSDALLRGSHTLPTAGAGSIEHAESLQHVQSSRRRRRSSSCSSHSDSSQVLSSCARVAAAASCVWQLH